MVPCRQSQAGQGSFRLEVPMPSPFPGMDPYLEDDRLWPSFQHAFVLSLFQALQPSLVGKYQIRVCERRYDAAGERQEEYLEIRQPGHGQLVTLVEVVSPANKLTDAGRTAYLDKRREGRSGNVNLIE